MSDELRLAFIPRPDDDAALAAQIAALYAATPPAEAGAAERCAREVLAQAMQPQSMEPPTRSTRKGLHPAWWWGVAAAALLVIAVRPWKSATPAVSAVGAATNVASAAEAFGRVTPISGSDAIRFDITLPANANRVAIVGDFNGWDASATPMQAKRESPTGRATWSAQIALAPGRHVYAFVIDGQRWLVDPLAPQVQDAGFGPSNAVMVDGGVQ
jgi:hypothetical protein